MNEKVLLTITLISLVATGITSGNQNQYIFGIATVILLFLLGLKMIWGF